MSLKRVCVLAASAAVLTLSVAACKKDKKDPDPTPAPVTPVVNIPSLMTSAVTAITDSSAVCGGTVTSQGTAAMLTVGVCWDTLPEPTTLRPHTDDGAGTGSYTSKLKGLKPGHKYYIRAYATNLNGTAYGEEKIFSTTKQEIWNIVPSLSGNTFNCMAGDVANLFAGTPGGVSFSPDSGRTWNTTSLTGKNVVYLAKINSVVFALAGGVIYSSGDNGGSLGQIPNFSGSATIKAIGVSGTRLVAGTTSGAYVSSDNGNSWQTANANLPTSSNAVANVGNITSNGQDLYAVATDLSNYQDKVFKFDAPNNSWTLSYNTPAFTVIDDLQASANSAFVSMYSGNRMLQGGNWVTLSALPAVKLNFSAYGSNVLATSSGNMLISDNDGGIWVNVKTKGLSSTSYANSFMSANYLWLNINNEVYRLKYR